MELIDQWQQKDPEDPAALEGSGKIKARNFPNPFNPTTRISFQIDEPGFVSVEIYNARGQKVQSLMNNEYRNEGLYEVNWDAKNDHGQPVPTGIYFYKISLGTESLTQQMLFIK